MEREEKKEELHREKADKLDLSQVIKVSINSGKLY